ncbi:MAG: hypothetical protein E4H01_16910, partial [Lysobacterales bacterium]
MAAKNREEVSVETLVDTIIDDDLAQYFCDSDAARQLVKWLHEETDIKTIYLKAAVKLIGICVEAASKTSGKWLAGSAVKKTHVLLSKFYFYYELTCWITQLKSRLDDKAGDRKALEDVINGKRPAHDVDDIKSSSQELRLILAVMKEVDKGTDQVLSVLDEIMDAMTPQPPLSLHIFELTERNRLQFGAQRVNFMGRRAELSGLQEFLNSERPFLWWSIVGPGGMGKSRLALELCLRNGNAWRVGFLSDKANFSNWSDFQPDQPTLMIVDYASRRAEELLTIISTLQSRTKPLEQPVRLLLIDRSLGDEAWEHDFWKSGRELYELDASLYAKESLPLKEMGPDDIWQIAKQVMDIHEYKNQDREFFLDRFRKIDSQSRPLSAAIAAEAMARGEDIATWDITKLLDCHLVREKELFWAPAGITEEYEYLLVLSTMMNGCSIKAVDLIFELHAIQKLFQPRKYNPEYVRVMTGRFDLTGVPPLEPDIIGELFVIRHVQRLLEDNRPLVDFMCLTAWIIHPGSYSDFLGRCIKDFPGYMDVVTELGMLPRPPTALPFLPEITLQGASNVIIHFGHANELEAARVLFSQMAKMAADYPDRSDIAKTLAKALANLVYYHGVAGEFDIAQEFLDRLAQ